QVGVHPYLPYVGFLITIFSALRLAKFNLDERQTTDFIGVNTPMNTFLVVSLPFLAEQYPSLILNAYFLIALTVISSLLLISEMRLFSMKLSSLSWRDNKFKYVCLLLSFVVVMLYQIASIPLVFVMYLLFSQLHFRLTPTEKSSWAEEAWFWWIMASMRSTHLFIIAASSYSSSCANCSIICNNVACISVYSGNWPYRSL